MLIGIRERSGGSGEDVCLDFAIDLAVTEALCDRLSDEIGHLIKTVCIPRLDLMAQRCSFAETDRGISG
jgi:hypothetical protein